MRPPLQRFDSIRMWKADGSPAPYKPLIILLALGKLSKGHEALSFLEASERLSELVKAFMPGRPKPRAGYPFWRLRSDGVWQVECEDRIRVTDSGDALIEDLKDCDAKGRFADDILDALKSDPDSIGRLAARILDANFPSHVHQGILNAVGLEPVQVRVDSSRLKRAAEFRRNVLAAYEERCCVCRFDLRVQGHLSGLEAAHIQALFANGPDEVPNGLSLCALHHAAFDRGAFTIRDDSRTIECSSKLSGNQLKWIEDFHGRKIEAPSSRGDCPDQMRLAWHRRNTFVGPGKDCAI